MDATRLDYFKKLLLSELRHHARQVGDEQANAIDSANDGAKDADLALRDVISELALNLGQRESQMIADIDQALLRMKEGSYGMCVRCNRQIDEHRLEAVPTARFDAACQTLIENEKNVSRPTL